MASLCSKLTRIPRGTNNVHENILRLTLLRKYYKSAVPTTSRTHDMVISGGGIFGAALGCRIAGSNNAIMKKRRVACLEAFKPKSFGRTFVSVASGHDNNNNNNSSNFNERHAKAAVELVERLDYEHYMLSIFFPPEKRLLYQTIRAYNAEISTIRDSVKGNELTAKMRFQFWRDTLENIYEPNSSNRQIANHPTVIALERACREARLGRQWLERCLNAKEAEMLEKEWTNLSDMEEYAEAAFSSLIYSTIECLGVPETHEINTAASHLGIAQGITTLIRAVPYAVETENRIPLAKWILAKNNCIDDDMFFNSLNDHNNFSMEGKNAIFEFASVAHNHLRSAKEMLTAKQSSDDALVGPLVDPRVYPAFLPAMLVQEYLNNLEKADFNVFDPNLRKREKRGWHTLKLLWKVYRNSNSGVLPFE
jgi:NADH dehydrogenase [ubiquinone] 1 alpha subcomplex assembly factor 6